MTAAKDSGHTIIHFRKDYSYESLIIILVNWSLTRFNIATKKITNL